MLACLISAPAIVHAQTPFQPHPILRLDGMRFEAPPKLRVLITDLDEQGRTQPPTAQRNYQLLINGLPAQGGPPKISTVSEANEPLSLAFVVQLGASMESVLPPIKKAIGEIASGISPSSTVRILGYSDQVKSDVTASTPADVHKAIEGLAIHPDALEMQLADAVQQALKPAPSIMVVLSDGTSKELSQQKFTEIGWHAKEKSVRIHTVGYAPIDDVPLKSTLSVLSKKTSGTERAAHTDDEFKDALRALVDEIRHQRILEYELPDLFTGQQYDFQITVDDLASETVGQIVPKAEGGGGRQNKTILVVLALGVSLALAGFGVMLMRRKKIAAKEVKPAPSARVEPKPEPEAEEDPRDKTKYDMRAVERPRPKAVASPVISVTPVLKEETDELPTIAPVKPAAPLVAETSAPKPVLFNIPSPTGFLKQLGHTPKPKVEVMPVPIAPISPPIAPPIAPMSQDQEDGESTMRMPAVERPSPPVVVSEPPAEAAPRFSANRTQVMSADEFETIDVAGWLVPIPAGTPTIVLEPGCAIGTSGGKFRVKPKTGAPSEATFNLNPLGRWVMFSGGDSRPLEDGMAIDIGDTKFVYKYAARLPVAQEERAPYLQIVGGLDDGRHILLDGSSRIIGSHPSANAIVRGTGVAPRHAVVRLQGTVCEIADLDSTTSLKAHGQSVLVTKLEPNDEVQLGSVRLVFKVPSR